jgi:bisanhydrobacterioruberin hydratase
LSLQKKYTTALVIALAFHFFGLIGMLNKIDFFLYATPINLLLCFALLMYTHEQPNKNLLLACSIIITLGFFAEVIGVNTGLLFGSYSYGTVLGPKIFGVPPLIGIIWISTIYMCASINAALHKKLAKKMSGEVELSQKQFKLSFIIDTALGAVIFDWIIEPVAVKLGYWQWQPIPNQIPIYNYVCWFVLSLLFAYILQVFKAERPNKFAVHLFMIQVLFFLILRTFL